MSKPMVSKEDAINQLYNTIKTKFEEDGVLKEVRCLLQAKMVTMMRGRNDAKPFVTRPAEGGDNEADSRVNVLNQLIMEYLHWHGFHYSAEMFALESGNENKKPMRQSLEGILSNFDHPNIPILLQLIADLMIKKCISSNTDNNLSRQHQKQSEGDQ